MSSSPNVVASAPTATADSKPAAKAPPQLTVVTTTPTTERQAILQLKEQCMAELRYWSSVLEQQTGADDFDDDDDAIPDGDGGDSVKHPPPQDVTTREEKSSFSFATMATQTYDDAEKSSIVTGHHHHQHDLHEQEEEEGIRPLPPEGDILYPSPSTRTADKSTKQAAAAEILHQISVGTSVRMRSPRNDNNNDNTNDNSFSKKQQQFINFITPGKPVGLLTSTSPKSTSSSIGLLPLPIILDRNHHKSNPKKRSGAAPSSEASVASATSALTMATAKPVSYSSSGQPQQQPQHFSSSEQQRKSGFVGIRELLNWDTESTTHQDQDSMAPLPTTLSMEARTAFKSPSAMAAKRLGLWRKKGWEEDHKVDEGDDESDSEKKVEYWWEHLENDPLGAAASAAEDEKNNNITCLVWGCTAKNDVAQTHSMLILEEEGTEGDTAATESNKNGNNTAQDWSSHLEDAVSPRRKRFVDIFATAIQTAYRRRLAQRRYRYVGQIIVRIQRWWRFRYGMKTLRTQYRRDQLRLAAGRQSRWAAQQLRLKQLHDKQREEQEDLHHDLLDELQRRADALRQRKEQEARALALLKEKEAEEFRKQKEREAEEFRKQTELEIQSFLEKKQREVEEIRQQKQREAEDDISKALTQDEMNFMMTIPESSSDLLLNNNNNNNLEGQQLAPWDRNTCAMACTMLEIFQNAFCDHPQTTAASEEDDPKKKTTTTTTNKKTPTTTSATTTLSKRFQWSNFPLLLDLLNKKSLEEEEEEEEGGGEKDIVDKENGFCNNHESTAATDEKANEGVDEELEQVEAQPPPTLTPIDAVDKSFAPEEQSSKDQEEPVLPSSSCTEQQEQQQQQQVEQPKLKEEEEKEITRHNETQVAGMFDDTVTKEESLCEVLMDGQPRENLFRLQVETDEAAKVLAIRNQDDHAQQEQQEEQQEQQQQQDFIFYLSNASSNVPQDQQVISNMSKVSTKVPQEEAADNDVHSDAPSDELGEECPYQEAQVQQQSSPNEEPADGVTAQVGSSTIEERIQQQHLQKTTRSSAQEESVHRHGHYEETSVGGFEPSTGTEIGEHGIVALGKSRSVTPPPHRSIRMDYVAIGDSNSLLWEDSRSDTGRRNDDANMDKAAGEEGGDLPAIPSDEVEDDKEKPNDEHRGESDTSQAGESGGDAVETNDAVSQLETTPESHQPVVDLSVQSKAEGEVTDDAIIQDPLDKKCVSNVVDEPNEVVLDKPHSFALFRCCAKIDDIALGDSTSLNFYEGDEFETKNDASMGTPLAERLDNDGHAALDGSDKTRHDKRDINEMGVSAIALVSQDAVTFDQDSAAQKGEEIESPTTSKRLTAEPDKSLSDIVQPESVVKASGSNSNVEEHNTCENLVEKNSICSKEESAVADSTDIVLVRPSNFSLFRCCARMDDIVVDQSKSLELHDFGGDEFRATRDDENMDKAGDDKLSEEVHEDQGQADEVDGTPRQDHLDYTEDKPKTGANHDAIAGDKNVATSDVALLTTNQSEDSNKYENENGSFKSKFVEMIDRLEREEEEQAFRSQSPSVAESIIRSQSIGEIYARDERSRLLERKNASATIESAFVGLDDKQHELLLAKSRSFTFFPCWTRFHAQEEEMPFDESRSIVVDESSSFVVDESKSRPCGVTDHDLEKHLTSDLRKSKEEVYTETASASVNIGTDRPLDEEMDVAKSTSQNHEEQRIVAASASQNERSEGGEAPALGPSLSTFSERGSPNVALSTGQSENNPVVDTQEESHFDESKQLELKCSRGAEIEVSCLNTVNPEEETEEVTSKVLANDHDCAKAPVDARLEENDSTRTEACVYNAFLESEVDQHHEVEDIAAKGSIHHNGCVETPVDPGPEGESSICTEGPGDSVLLGGAAVKENDEVGDVTANDDKAAIDTNTCPETSIDSGPGEASTCTEEVRDDNVLPGAEINQQDEVVVDGTANDDVAAMDNDTSTEPPIDSTRKGETSTRTEVQEEDALLQAEKVEAGGVTANVDAAAAIDIDIGTSTETPVDSTLDEKACTRTEVQDENALLEADQVEASVVTANVDDAAAIDICTSTETPVDPSLEEKASTCTEVKDDNVLLEPGVNQGDSVVDVTAIEAAAATDSNSRPETPVDPSLDEKASTCTEERDDDVVLVAEVKLQDEVVDGTANDDGTAIDSNTCLETPVDSKVSICTEVQEEDALLEAEKVEAGGVIANVDAAIDIDIGTSTETPVDSSLDEKTSTRTEVQDKNALLEVEANDVTENVDATAIDIATVIKTPVDSSLEEVASTCTQVRNKNVLGGSTSPETPVDSSLDEKAFTCTEVQDDDVVLVAEVNQQDVVVDVTTNDDEAIDIGTSTETRVDSSLDEKASTRTEVQEEDALLEAEKVEAVGVTANVDAAIDIGACTETPVDSSLDEIASTRTEVQDENALLEADEVEAGGVTANVDAAAAIDIDIGTSTETPVDSTLDEKACTRTEVQDENALLEADQVEASVVTANVDDAAAIDICTSTETPVDPSLEEKASTCTEVQDDNVLLEPGVNQGDSVVDVTAIEAAAATDSNSRPETPVDPSLDEKASTCTEERDDDVVLVAEVKLQDEVVDGTANDDGTAIDSNTCLETPVDSRVSICTEVQEEDALLEAEKVEAGGVIANVDAAIDIDIGTSTETPVDSSLDEKTSTRTEVQDKNALLEVEANDVTENVDATAIDIATVIKTPVDSSLEEVASTCTQVRNKNVLGGSTSPETPVDSSLDEKAFTCTEVQDDDVVLVAEVNQQDVVVVTTNDDEAIDIGTSTETRVDSSLDEKASTRTEVQEEDALLEAEKVEAVGVTANVDAAIDIGTCTETPVDSSLDEIASTRTEVQDENALLEADEVEAGGVTANVDDAAAIDIGTSMETPVDSKPEREASTSTKVRHDNVPPDDEANEQDDSDEVAADDDDAIEIGTGPETAIETRLPPEEDDSTLTEVLVDQQAGLSEIEAKLDTINRSNELTYSASGADQCDIVEVEANDISIDQRSTVSDEKHLPTTGSLFDQQGDLSALKEKTDPRGEERGTEQSDNDADDAEHAFEENYVKKLEQTESEASLVVASTEELPCSKIQIAEPERQDEEAINPKSSAGAYCAGDGSRNEIAPANGEASSAYTETQKSTLVDNTQSSALIAADTDAHQHVAKESKATSFEESARDEDEADRHVEPENESSREVPTEQKDECTQLEDRDDPEEAPKAETAEKSACDDLTKRYSFYKPLERPEIKDTNTEEVQTHPDNDMEKAASEAASSGHPTKLDKEQNIVAEHSAPATKEASSVELDAQRENVSRSSRIFSFFPCCTAMDIQDDVVPMDNSKLEACDKDEETVQAEIENYSVDEPAGQKLENLLPAVDVHPKAAVIVEGTKDSSVESSNCESPTKRYHFYEPRVGSPSEGHTETTEAPETEVATVDPSTKRFSYYKPIVDEQTEDVQNQVDDSNGHLDDAPKPEKPNDAGESTVLETPAQQKEDHKRTLETNGDATARGLLRSLVSVDAVEQPESQNILYRKDGLRKCDEVAPVQPADDEPEDMFNENADDEVEVAIDKDPSSGESEESIEVALSKARRRRAKERRRQELDDVCLERFSSREALEKEILLSMSKSTECSTARELTQLGSGGAENDGLLDDTSCGEIERFSSREAFEDVVLGQIGSRDPFARIESKSEKVRNKADMNVPEEDYAEPAMPQIESLANSALMVNNQVEEAAAPRSGESDHGDDKTCKVKPNEKVQIEEASKDPVVTSSNIKDDHAEANGESKEAEAEGKGANEQLIMVKVQDDHVEVEVTQRNGDTDNQEEGGDGDYCEGMIESQDSGSSILAETNTQRDIIPDNTRSFTMFGCCVKMEDGALDTANSIEMGESAFEERQDFFMCKANLKEEEIVFHKFNQGVDDDDDDDDDDTYNNQAGAEAISSPLPTIVERDSSNGSMQDEGEEEEEQRQEKSAMEQQQDQENEQLQQAEEPIIVDHKESPEKKGPSSPDIVLNNTRSFTFFTCCAKMQDDPLVGMVNSLEEEEASSPAAEPAETSPKTTSAVETSRDTNYVPPPIKQQNSTDRKLEELERNLIRLRKQRCFDELLGWVNEGEDIWLQQQKSNEK
ncbi:hypothetical protein ACA910_011718 [Epithemia clementina (nom. ined.)]